MTKNLKNILKVFVNRMVLSSIYDCRSKGNQESVKFYPEKESEDKTNIKISTRPPRKFLEMTGQTLEFEDYEKIYIVPDSKKGE